ncbi:response regulator transcription factor, partial [Pengzhenrongella frigida]
MNSWFTPHAGGLAMNHRPQLILTRREAAGEDVAVTIEQSSPAERAAVFSRAFGLSGRETELLGFLGQGSGTRGIARQMFVSENTVQDHLKSIFAKTGEHSRPRLVSRAFGS